MRVLASLVSMGRGVPRYVMALLLSVFLIGGTAWAQEYNKIRGAGYASCEDWTNGRPNSARDEWDQWLYGYLTAYSVWVEKSLGHVSKANNDDPLTWIDLYYQENPLEKVADAAELLIFAIKAK